MTAKTLEHHLSELRERLKHSIIVLVVLTAVSFYFSSTVLEFFQKDLDIKLHALTAYEALYTQIVIALILGFFLALPAILYQALKFIKPGLRENEYRILRNYLPFSIILFVGGAIFAYNFIVKFSISFLSATTSRAGVEAVWGLQNTIGFALKLSAFSGVMFQLPIVSMVLSKAGLIKSEQMSRYRPHFFVFVLFTAAIATPPDIITQVIITVPVLLLYQASIFMVSRSEGRE